MPILNEFPRFKHAVQTWTKDDPGLTATEAIRRFEEIREVSRRQRRPPATRHLSRVRREPRRANR